MIRVRPFFPQPPSSRMIRVRPFFPQPFFPQAGRRAAGRRAAGRRAAGRRAATLCQIPFQQLDSMLQEGLVLGRDREILGHPHSVLGRVHYSRSGVHSRSGVLRTHKSVLRVHSRSGVLRTHKSCVLRMHRVLLHRWVLWGKSVLLHNILRWGCLLLLLMRCGGLLPLRWWGRTRSSRLHDVEPISVPDPLRSARRIEVRCSRRSVWRSVNDLHRR